MPPGCTVDNRNTEGSKFHTQRIGKRGHGPLSWNSRRPAKGVGSTPKPLADVYDFLDSARSCYGATARIERGHADYVSFKLMTQFACFKLNERSNEKKPRVVDQNVDAAGFRYD